VRETPLCSSCTRVTHVHTSHVKSIKGHTVSHRSAQLNQTGHLKTWREGVGVSAQEREAAERVEGGGWRRHHCATVIRESHLSH